jgi:thymidylate synthase
LFQVNTYRTLHEAYLASLADVYDNPDHVAEPRGQRTREKLNYQFVVTEPTVEPVVTHDPERNEVIKDYTAKEVALYDSGTNRAEDFGRASKFWLKLANPDGTVNSAYGYLIWNNKSHGNAAFEIGKQYNEMALEERFAAATAVTRTPWEWAKESLLADKDTRQAILRFSLPCHQWKGNKDQVCTLHGLFLIRDNKLNLSINMRSNDLTLGLVYDLPWFISLIYRMRDELKGTYPDLGIGTYSHYVHSLHIYDRDEEKILKMLGRK